MEIKLKTLTPIWTGGVDGHVDRLHETGLIGSLRWWYEALVRGLGGYACDPTSGKCGFNLGNYQNSTATDEHQRLRDAGLCDVCQVFGATGWRRRFRLDVEETALADAPIAATIKLHNREYTRSDGRKKLPAWYFRYPKKNNAPNTPKVGAFAIHVHRLFDDFQPEIIAGLLQFIADWSALGARGQMGFGVIMPDERVNARALYEQLSTVTGRQTYPHLPSLRNIFLARIAPQSEDQRFRENDTFVLKYDLRRLFADHSGIRHFVMGKVYMSGPRKGQRLAAKIKLSRPYQDGTEMRIWGWIPEESDAYRQGWDRERIIKKIHAHLNRRYQLLTWREMNTSRDSITPNHSDAVTFLQSLLGIQGE